ncbi:MAG: hypothetical protein AAF480_09515 [Actinomycetota bacterium]
MDWRVATVAACVAVGLVVAAFLVFDGDDEGQVVQAQEVAAQDAAAQDADTEPSGAEDQDADTEPSADEDQDADAAEPTATPVPGSAAEPTATSASTASPTPDAGDDEQAQGVVHPIPGEGCVVFIHGAGWSGAPYTEDGGDTTFIWPYSGNDEFPHFWLYDGPYLSYGDDDTAYDAAVANIRDSIDANNCGPVMITGASNGGAFLAKMYCRGEDFSGRLWAVHVDDPVPDAGVLNCNPSSTVVRTMFTHSTQLVDEAAELPGGICSATTSMYGSWYCEDDRALTLDEYEAAIGETSILSRAEHSGRASAETDFWQFVTPWFHEYDPDRFSAIPN